MARTRSIKPEDVSIRGICVICNKNPQKKVGGKNKYMSMCTSCNKKLYMSDAGYARHRKRIDEKARPYRKYVKDKCEKCGFIPEHICQLDVDHIDNNHSNNVEENFQTLCANCHRLKTHNERKTGSRGFIFTRIN